jgi:hypothetical protein
VQADEEQVEPAGAWRQKRRRPNKSTTAVPDETRSLRAAHAKAQAQALGEMERARVTGLELQQARADVSRLQVEAKVNDEVFQAAIRSKDELLLFKDAVIESKVKLLQAKDAEIRRHADLERCGAESAVQAALAAAVAPAHAPAPGHVASCAGCLRQVGSFGALDGQFQCPRLMARDQQEINPGTLPQNGTKIKMRHGRYEGRSGTIVGHSGIGWFTVKLKWVRKDVKVRRHEFQVVQTEE